MAGITNESLFSSKPIPGATTEELTKRAEKKWNPMNGQAKTWVHVMSLAEGEPNPISTFKNYSDAYDKASNRPRKVIQSLKVAAKGEYGTTRSATLNLMFFSDEELNIFATSYLIPDMSVRVQWGWSVSATGEVGPQPITGAMLDNDAIKEMQTISSQYANYEGFQGRVVSWDVSLEPKDNAWSVNLELIGAANSVSETAVSQMADNCKCKKTVTGQTADGNEEKQEVVEESSALQAALLELYDDPNNITTVKAGTKGYDGEFVAETIAYPGFSRDETGEEDSDSTFFIDADLDAEETYVSWGTVESLFSFFSAQQLTNDGPAAFKVDSRGLTVKVPTTGQGKWFSADPRVCILPGGGLIFERPTDFSQYAAAAGNLVAAGFQTAIAIGSFGLLASPPIGQNAGPGYGQSSGDCFESTTVIRLTDIRVSTIHLLKRLKEFESNKDTVMTAFKTLLSDVNKACGSPWEFEMVDVSTQTGASAGGVTHLAIIDVNAPELKEEPFEFLATPGNGGFCREIKLELKMTDAMKTQALYGANGSTTVPSAGDTPCTSRFMQYTKTLKVNTGKYQISAEVSTAITDLCRVLKICNESNPSEDPVAKLQKEAVGVNIDGARAYLEGQKRQGELAALAEGGISAYCASAALPMKFSATLTGIGGFRWGQTVTCDRLPDDMKRLSKYQVTTVEHDISPDDWTTTINTVARKRFS